ncbi:MAG: hypothetical protein ACYDAI_13485 [Trichloromonadaceae bacterium]
MKKYVLIGLVLAVGVAAGVLFSGPGQAVALNVSEVAADPAAFSGTITVTGVTAGFAPHDPTLFGVMDIKELQCTTPNCNKVLIPVRVTGTVPALGDEVRISGTFVHSPPMGYVLTAETVKVVRNHKLGG